MLTAVSADKFLAFDDLAEIVPFVPDALVVLIYFED
jgi:hypothetical protein